VIEPPPRFCAAAGVAASSATLNQMMDVVMALPGSRLVRKSASHRFCFL
jgi:hypothetical protein